MELSKQLTTLMSPHFHHLENYMAASSIWVKVVVCLVLFMIYIVDGYVQALGGIVGHNADDMGNNRPSNWC